MIPYLKAEIGLCKKNRANFILGACGLFVYCLLLLFSGVGGVKYVALISLFGWIDLLFFLIPWFVSPISYFFNGKKICVSSEHMALMLGESKRTFLKIRILVCVASWFLLLCVIAVMQIPAYLIAREQYSFFIFGTEVMAVTGFTFLSVIVLFLCPGHRLMLGVPLWSGFCGGIAGAQISGVAGVPEKTVFQQFAVIAIIGTAVCVVSVAYRYRKTIWEERRR